jgi:hypothetical protein
VPAGIGGGANILVGGTGRAVALQPLERFPIQWNRKAALRSCIVAFSRREPVSVSLEYALEHFPLKSIRFEQQEYAPALESGAISCRPGDSTRWTSALAVHGQVGVNVAAGITSVISTAVP